MKTKQSTASNPSNNSSVTQVIGTFLPYWPLFLIFLLISIGGAYAYLSYATPQYEASATIIIKDEKKGYDDSKLTESLNLINTKKIIENEVEVLQSRTLMNAVVKKLHLYAPVITRGKIKVQSAYELSPIIVEAKNPDSISHSPYLSIQYNDSTGLVMFNKQQTFPLGQWFNTPYGSLRFLKNNKYLGYPKTNDFYFSVNPIKSATASILMSLKVMASSKLSSVIDLTYRDAVPKRAEDILNELVIAYGDAALSEKNNLAKNTLAFIEARLNIVSKDLDSIESKLQKYKAGRGAVDIGRQGQLYLENVSSNDKRLTDVNMQIAVMDQLQKAAAAPSNNSGMVASALGVTDPTLLQQMNNLSTLQMQYDKLKLTVAENNPLLLSVNEQINRIKPTILNNIESQRSSLQTSRNNLSAAGGGYSSVLSAIPQKERQLIEISRDQNIKNNIYQFLLQKREESELSYASTIADSRVVNLALAGDKPVSPNAMIIYIAALILGLGFPIAFVTAREILSPKILYRQELETLTNVPIIGEISFNTSEENIVIEKGKRTVIAEEFRKIRVSLSSLGFDSNHKKILITSSISGEGKSFVAANLATSLSLTGKKVVLMDLDLHNPGLGKFFGIKEQPGVSEYLIGKRKIEDIIYRVSDRENLYYISCGTLQQDSSELLENGMIQKLITKLDEEFDVVIIDTAPVVLITDPYLLSFLCDLTLYVVRHKFTPKLLVERVDNNMIINPINNPGIIFNGVKTRGFFKNNYGYGYNYTYSYDNKKEKKIAVKNSFSNNGI